MNKSRVLSGMRPTGALHLGHYYGVIKNWLKLQSEYDCFYFVADWHALTTHYEDPSVIPSSTREMVIDWLASGIDPNDATIFVQSHVPQHAELHLLLSMIVPLGWLERVPSYKDQQEKLRQRDLATYGFLGYPLLQCADILVYRAQGVPIGEDQVAHLELTREVARRFNHFYGRLPDFDKRLEESLRKMGRKGSKAFQRQQKAWQEQGDQDALAQGKEMIASQDNLSFTDKELLLAALEGSGRTILPAPQALLTPASRVIGLDGQKMSKSYNNTISLRDPPDQIRKAMSRMPTDPARARRTDPGNPEKCPVWQYHKLYSSDETMDWVKTGCITASIGCLECKQPAIDAVIEEIVPLQAKARQMEEEPELVNDILSDGAKRARRVAEETMQEVREVMSLVADTGTETE